MTFECVLELGEKRPSLIEVLLQGGVTYIAQVLKRNRTLKVLNLSGNKIDVQGLATVAEALVSSTFPPRESNRSSNQSFLSEIQLYFGNAGYESQPVLWTWT